MAEGVQASEEDRRDTAIEHANAAMEKRVHAEEIAEEMRLENVANQEAASAAKKESDADILAIKTEACERRLRVDTT